jgi:hypothetical protein
LAAGFSDKGSVIRGEANREGRFEFGECGRACLQLISELLHGGKGDGIGIKGVERKGRMETRWCGTVGCNVSSD